MEINERIEKDIKMFYQNLEKINKGELNEQERKIVDLAELYAKDSKSWLDKKDVHTSFACISYAHGLLDAILKFKGKEDR